MVSANFIYSLVHHIHSSYCMTTDTFFFSNFPDEKYLAIVSSRPRVISWEIGEEILKFPNDLVIFITYSGYEYLSLQVKSIITF